jgi:hypothetical protein
LVYTRVLVKINSDHAYVYSVKKKYQKKTQLNLYLYSDNLLILFLILKFSNNLEDFVDNLFSAVYYSK